MREGHLWRTYSDWPFGIPQENLDDPPLYALDRAFETAVSIFSENRPQILEEEENPMNNSQVAEQSIGPQTPSTTQPIDRDKPLPIREWQQKFEYHLDLIGKKETRKRYARALERFLGKHPTKTYAHQFLRPVINSYVETRLSEGASVATVRLELSAVRGLFQFALDMGAADVMFNPARGVKVKKPKVGSPRAASEATESAA